MPEAGRRHRRASLATTDPARLGDPGIEAGVCRKPGCPGRCPRPTMKRLHALRISPRVVAQDRLRRHVGRHVQSHGSGQPGSAPAREQHPGTQDRQSRAARSGAVPGSTGEPLAHPGPGQNVGPKKPRQSLCIRSSWLPGAMVQVWITQALWRQWSGVGRASCRSHGRCTTATLRPRIRPTPEGRPGLVPTAPDPVADPL
jgi:hypothetical protein